MTCVKGTWGIYAASKQYGIPRIYRRMLEANKMYTPIEQQKTVGNSIAKAIRAPTQAYSIVQQSPVYALLQQAAKHGIPKARNIMISVCLVPLPTALTLCL